MKRIAGIVLPLLLVAACTEDDSTTSSGRTKTFTAGYDMGTQVVMVKKSTRLTKNYVQLDGKVTQVEGLETAVANPTSAAACQTRTDKRKVETADAVTGVSKTRIAGVQKAWMLPSNFGTAAAQDQEPGTNVWGDPASGWLFMTEPNLDILLSVQSAGAGDNRHLTQYLRTTPVNLFVFEDDQDVDMASVTTTSTSATNSMTVTKDETVSVNNCGTAMTNLTDCRRNLSTYTRFDIGNFVWQTNPLNNIYGGAPVNYNAFMVVPESVKVGDTWLSNNGTLMSAVAVEAVDAGNATVRALHVIERGSTDVDLADAGVAGWCVNYFTGTKTNTTETRDTVITDLCDGPVGGAYTGPGVQGKGTGWVNLKHTWYYKGLPVKYVAETIDVSVAEYGYVLPNPNGTFNGAIGNYPVPTNGNNAGECAFYEANVAPLAVTMATTLKPYARFSVSKTHEEWNAIEVKNGYTIAKEYAEEKAAQ